MDVVRNFIHVVGITPEEQLPQKINGQLIQYSDIDTFYIPDGLPPAKSIFQIMLQVGVKSGHIIETPVCRTMVVDGVKNFKIMYTADGGEDKASFAVITAPYNTFIEMQEGQGDIAKIDVYILDAYFSLLDSRRIYSYILYLVHAGYGPGRMSETVSITNRVLDTEASLEDVPVQLEAPTMMYDTFSSEPDIDAEYL